jgi:GNAT superfamily N-acetyltransferase
MLTVTRDDGYLLSGDPDRLDVDRVHHWIATDTYWAPGRSRDLMLAALAGSQPFGVYRPGDGRQVAFARLVTDGAVFAYLADVYVDRAVRGLGLGTWLVGNLRDELRRRGLRRFILTTHDAQPVYARVGFVPVRADRWMECDLGSGS